MSRVDEAMQRARERANEIDATPGGNPPPTVAFPDRDVSADHFPIEMIDQRRQPRPVSQSAHHPAAAAIETRPIGAGAAKGASSSLLDRIDHGLVQKVVIDQNMAATSREQYRRLAASLHHQQQASGLKVVMIVSAAPGEGKTLTAANLGLTFSESYRRRVLLIDADLRRPALHKVFGTDNSSGLVDGLQAMPERKVPVRQVSESLALLQAGGPSSDPMAGLTSARMQRLIAEARETFDWVIIDSPPVALLPDANLLGAMVDGAVMVVKAGSTSYDLVKKAIETIGRQRILGVVLNRAETVPHAYGYDDYDSYCAAERKVAASS